MIYQPSRLIRSMILFSWRQADYVVSDWVRWLGLGLTGCKPFLPRPLRQARAANLAQLEPLVRRLLFLMAFERGALPLPQRQPHQPAARTPSAPPQPRASQYLRTPRFCIAEPPVRPGHGQPPRRAAAGGPAIRYLDMPLPPPGPFDYPPRKTDLLPARALVQRLRALMHVFDNPDAYITAMQRRLSEPTPPVRLRLPPGLLNSRLLSKPERETARQIHAEAAALVPHLNSS